MQPPSARTAEEAVPERHQQLAKLRTLRQISDIDAVVQECILQWCSRCAAAGHLGQQ